MFEITGDDISLLNDEDLRAVIGRLCEAELRRQGYPVCHAAWGGNQTASVMAPSVSIPSYQILQSWARRASAPIIAP